MSTLAKHPLRFVLPIITLILGLFAHNAKAVLTQYWDINGATAGAGGGATGAPSGSWEAANWATASGGTAATAAWQEGSFPRFSAAAAGTDATNNYTVTANANHRIAGAYINPSTGYTNTVTITGTGALSIDATNGVQQGFFGNAGLIRINNKITGLGGIISSTGQLFIENTNNDYSGGTSISTGLINFGAGGGGAVFGTNGIGIASTGTALIAEATGLVVPNNFTNRTLAGGLNLSSTGTTFTTTYNGDWYLGTNSLVLGAGGGTGDTVILNGAISGSGNLGRQSSTAHGAIKLLSTNSTFTGKTTLQSSATYVTTVNSWLSNQKPSSSLGAPTSESAATISMGATTFTGTMVYVGPGEDTDREIDMAGTTGGATIQNDGTGVLNFTSPGFANGVGNKTFTLSGSGIGSFTSMSENGVTAFTKAGAGKWTLTGQSAYSGLTTLSLGTLILGTDNALPSGTPVTLTVTNVTLDLNGHNNSIAALSGKGIITNHTGALTIGGDSSTTLVNAYSSFNGPVSGNGSIVKSGSHTMSIHSTNYYNNPFTLNSGTLSLGAGPNRLPPTSTFDLTSSTLELEANSQTIAGLSGSGKVNLGGGNLTIAASSFVNFPGTIQDSDVAGSSVALGHGLRGYYYDNPDFTTLLAVRDDANVNFTDLTSAAQLPAAVYNSSAAGTNTTSIRWLGQVQSTAAGTYTFSVTADDGKRLWVNGVLVVDAFVSGSSTASGTITLAANTRYDIVLEYYNGTGGAAARLFWTPPGDTVSSIIPTDYLYLPGAGSVTVSSGFVNLTSPNTYSGNTFVTGGTLHGGADGAFGKGNVSISNGATLTLDSGGANNYINDNSDLVMNGATSVLNLNYSGSDTIRGFSTNGGATYLAVGTYGGPGSGATFIKSQISGTGVLNVTAGPSANVLTSSGASAVYGSTITFTSTITGSGATPTGTVTLYDGASAIAVAALDGAGQATFAISALSVVTSPHSITAVYSGDTTKLSSTSSVLTETITQLPISFSTINASNKVYDGTINASITAASLTNLIGVLASDTNNVRIATAAQFLDKNVGTAKTVTNVTLAGSLGGNYVLTVNNSATTANITTKAVTVTGITAASRVYNGDTNAVIDTTAAAPAGIIGGDSATLNTAGAVGSFATPTVGAGKVVTIRGLTLTGADAGNYTITNPTVTGLAITQASTTNSLTSSANPATSGASVTFTSTPTPVAPGAGMPTGNIVFLTNSVAFSTNALVSGTISTAAILPDGTNTVTAQYAGDANFIGSTNSISQIVGGTPVVLSTNIVITRYGKDSVLTWTGTGILQTTTNIATNWVDVPSATSPYTNNNPATSSGAFFFRLKN